jgi:hypothetical protein
VFKNKWLKWTLIGVSSIIGVFVLLIVGFIGLFILSKIIPESTNCYGVTNEEAKWRVENNIRQSIEHDGSGPYAIAPSMSDVELKLNDRQEGPRGSDEFHVNFLILNKHTGEVITTGWLFETCETKLMGSGTMGNQVEPGPTDDK